MGSVVNSLPFLETASNKTPRLGNSEALGGTHHGNNCVPQIIPPHPTMSTGSKSIEVREVDTQIGEWFTQGYPESISLIV